jgi:hypothetical protein
MTRRTCTKQASVGSARISPHSQHPENERSRASRRLLHGVSGVGVAFVLVLGACSGDSTGPGSTSSIKKATQPTQPSNMQVAEGDDGANWETEAGERFQGGTLFQLYGWGTESSPPDGGGGGGGASGLTNDELAGLAWGEGWDSMHDNEKLFYIRNWKKWGSRIDLMKTITRVADSLAAARFHPAGVRDGYRENAWKHALWTCGMTRSWGATDAKAASDVHEDWPGNPAADKTMDLHNNQVGISTANRTSDCFDDVSTAQDQLVWIYND